MISSANKCIQGVPGFGFIIARKSELAHCKGVSRSLSLDIYDQWETMEKGHGKWRFTSPTHVVRAFKQAMDELEAEGGVQARHERYCRNHEVLVAGMRSLGFKTLLDDTIQSPIITSLGGRIRVLMSRINSTNGYIDIGLFLYPFILLFRI